MQAAMPRPFENRPLRVKCSETRHTFPFPLVKVANASLLMAAFVLTASCTDTASSSTTTESNEIRSSLAKPSEFVKRWNNCAKQLPTFETVDKFQYADGQTKREIVLPELDNYISPHGAIYFFNSSNGGSTGNSNDAIASYSGSYEINRSPPVSNDANCLLASATFDLSKEEIQKIISTLTGNLTSSNHVIESLDYKNKSFWIQIYPDANKYKYRLRVNKS